MRSKSAPVLAAGLAALVLLAAGAEAQTRLVEKPGRMEFSGQMIVKPKRVDSDSPLARERYRHALDVITGFDLVEHQVELDHYILRIAPGDDENAIRSRLMATGAFEFVEPNWRVFPLAASGSCSNYDDPVHFGNQWHHETIESCNAWTLHTGTAETVIAICDTGIKKNHEDLWANRQLGYNAVNQAWEGEPGGAVGVLNLPSGPVRNHGTLVTGLAAGTGNNGLGISGVGWGLGHRMVRFTNGEPGLLLSVVAHGAVVAAKEGDRVFSASLGGVESETVRSLGATLRTYGTLLIWSAGNDSADLDWGHRDADQVIVVGSTNQLDELAGTSAYGLALDIVAPGVGVYTTDADGLSDYAFVSGTSFATPLVAGLCGLLFSYDPTLSPEEVEHYLKAGVTDLGDPGQDDEFGHGRINAYQSLLLVSP